MNSVFHSLVRYDLAISLHAVMFVPAIERLSTDEQRDKWLPLAMSMQIIGSYAQTEMGHGELISYISLFYNLSIENFRDGYSPCRDMLAICVFKIA